MSSTTKSPWGVCTQPECRPLSEIMDEELAMKLQEEDQQKVVTAPAQQQEWETLPEEDTQNDSGSDTEFGWISAASDEELAHKLAEEEDYLFALQLQACYTLQSATQGKTTRNETVFSTSTSIEQEMLAQEIRQLALAADSSRHQKESTPPEQPPSRSPNRQERERHIITKHDPVVCGKRNAAKLEEMLDGNMEKLSISTPVFNALQKHARKEYDRSIRYKDREDRATTDQVLDTATRLIILKLLNKGVLEEVAGVLNTGKEASVYHATQGSFVDDTGHKPIQTPEYAVKVFRTLNEFKNREIYLEGEFLRKYLKAKHNPKKCIKVWAQKELQNLRRMHKFGVPCPEPVGLYGHVLVMEFIGASGLPAPILKDAKLSIDQWAATYAECILCMRKLYQECQLVHADLSEFNILYPPLFSLSYIQDTSTAIFGLLMLRKYANIVMLIERAGLPGIIHVRELFEFICNPAIAAGAEVVKLKELIALASSHGPHTPAQQVDEAVFLKSFIPRSLAQVPDPVRYIEGAQHNDPDTTQHLAVSGLKPEDTLVVRNTEPQLHTKLDPPAH